MLRFEDSANNNRAGNTNGASWSHRVMAPRPNTCNHSTRQSTAFPDGLSTRPNMRYSFGKTRRVTRSGDFTKIIRLGTCVADGTLVLFALPRTVDDKEIRIGITIPKKMGNAVVRNRWKRLIRESFRQQQAILPAGYEFIVRPKRGATPDWIAIEKSIPRLARKAAKRASQTNST